MKAGCRWIVLLLIPVCFCKPVSGQTIALPVVYPKDDGGVPDARKTGSGLDPDAPDDGKSYNLNEDHTNIEGYLNSLVSSGKYFFILKDKVDKAVTGKYPEERISEFSRKLQPVGRILESEGYYVWCCAPIVGEDGKVHVFYSRWPEKYGMGGWISKCEIAHAVADRPEGPYTFVETILAPRPGYFDATTCHNPHIQYVNGTYYLFYMGNSDGSVYTKRIGLATSRSLYGPWERREGPVLEAGETDAWDDCNTTNPAFVMHPDGEAWLYYKSWNKAAYQKEKGAIRANRKYGLAKASQIDGPYKRYEGNPVVDFSVHGDNKQVEDAYVYIEDGVFKMLMRDMGYFDHEVGLIFESEDGIGWSEPQIAWFGAGAYLEEPPAPKHLKRYGRLERPQLLMKDGRPAYLFHAMQGGKYGTASGFVFKINKLQHFMKRLKNLSFVAFAAFLFSCGEGQPEKINRFALVDRNNPRVTEFEELSSLSAGNGNFAVTVDATGLQTFPELYSAGVPLGTQSQWGWHRFPDTQDYKPEETWRTYNFRGWGEPYAVQFNEPGRQQDAANYFRVNPHRLHLGYIGLELVDESGEPLKADRITGVQQELHLWDGLIDSRFMIGADSAHVKTVVHPGKDRLAASLHSSLIGKGVMKVNLKFPYPTGNHADDATDWSSPQKHKTEIVSQSESVLILKRTLDETVYYVTVNYEGKADIAEKAPHYFVLSPRSDDFEFTCEFTDKNPAEGNNAVKETFKASSAYWQAFWKKGGAIDFSKCTDERAGELERRIVLSQYLMAIQSAGMYPPQETGLTYNSWFGKFHLEMHWWHAVHFALWGRADLLERSMDWYAQAYPIAKSIAERQGFKGARWMKMTDPSGIEAPSKVGSFLIWQQPHFIYMAELIYRDNPSDEVIRKYKFLVNETAEFMASFATYDELEGRYLLKGIIPAQETLRASETINPPFELSYWHYAMSVAQQWRERAGEKRKPQWDELIDKLSPLTYQDGLYLASEDAVDTYKDIRFTSDHPAVLGALGILPQCKLVRPDYMANTLNWIWENWNWGKTWGWDYPMTAMSAARLGDPEKAVGALLMDKRTNTYLVNGHNYQDSRLRVYLPGNGGLLTAVAMMCAGWDGNEVKTPGFPKDGKWNVVWEGLQPMP